MFNTGDNLTSGQPDPHWEVVAVSNDPNFRARPAIVWPPFGVVLMTQSQPISLVGPVTQLPDNTFYTFRTTFDVPAAIRLNSIQLNGRFIVDNHIQAIRLNGHEVRVPGHWYADFDFSHVFSITRGFVAGKNVLEIDVENGVPDHHEGARMRLQVEMKATARETLPPWNQGNAEGRANDDLN